MIPTVQRVQARTHPSVQQALDQDLQANLERTMQGGQEAIQARLRELDAEWDLERIIEIEAPLMIALGVSLGMTRDRRWLALSAAAASMVLVHGFQGWYPLMPLLRRLGVRSQQEIEDERMALRILAGDALGHAWAG